MLSITQSLQPKQWLQSMPQMPKHLSVENKRCLAIASASLALGGLVFAPARLLALPSLMLTTASAFQKAVEKWQSERHLGDAFVEASLMTLLIASNHLLLGAVGTLLLSIESADDTTTPALQAIAFSSLALPTAGLGGMSATLYAFLIHHSPRASTQRNLSKSGIQVYDWRAVRKLTQTQKILLDQSCLVTVDLVTIHAFQRRLVEDVAHHALTAADPQLRCQILAAHPTLFPEGSGGDVQLLTYSQLQTRFHMPQSERANFLYVLLDCQIIGALEVVQSPMPAARQLLSTLDKMEVPIVLLSNASLRETEALQEAFSLDLAHANMQWQQKVIYCQEQTRACFIGRSTLSRRGLADVVVTLSKKDHADVSVDESSFELFYRSIGSYNKHRLLRHVSATTPLVVTVGGVFFLKWGLPMALAVHGVSLIGSEVLDRYLNARARKSHSKQDLAPALAQTALTT